MYVCARAPPWLDHTLRAQAPPARTNERIFLIISPRFCTCGPKKVAPHKPFVLIHDSVTEIYAVLAITACARVVPNLLRRFVCLLPRLLHYKYVYSNNEKYEP
jgi:hypothetical protein